MRKKLTTLTVCIMMAVLLLSGFSLSVSAATAMSKTTVTYTSTQTYTGKAIKPKVTVKYGKKTVSSKYYTVSYKNNKSVGVATITLKGKGSYTGTVTKKFYIVPKKVTSLKATSDDDSITLTWKKSTGADGYRIEQYNSSKKTWSKVGTTTSAKYTVKKLTSATEYKLRVSPYLKNGSKYYYGSSVSVTTATEPTNPTSLKFTSAETSITLSWKKVSRATGYMIYRYDTKDKEWDKLKTTSDTSYTATKLSADTAYRFRIKAYFKKNDKTYYSDYVYDYAATTPKKPSALNISNIGDDSVKLSWNKVSGATGYKLYVSEYVNGKASSYEHYLTVKSNSTTSATISSLKGNTTYRFRIRTYFSDKNCDTTHSAYVYSKECTTDLPAVHGLYLSDYTNTSLTFGWDTPNGDIDGYCIYAVKNGEKELLASIDKEAYLYTVNGLEEDKDYSFYIATYFQNDGEPLYGEAAYIEARTDDSRVDAVIFTKKKSTISIGGTYQLEATVVPSYAANKKLTYKSSNTDVVTVSQSGLLTALDYGSSIITATSEDGAHSTSFNLTVKKIVSTKISLPKTVTLFVGESGQTVYPAEIVPTFTPSDTTDKTYSVYAKDYTYSYEQVFSTKTDTCKFSDYITFSDGKFTAKKATVEPKGDNNVFAFEVTFMAKDSGKTVTTKIQVIEKAPNLTLTDNNGDWFYGNTSTLDVGLDSYLSFTEDDLGWKSSNPEVASVDGEGNITCNGIGQATITVYAPWKALRASYTIYVRSTAQIKKDYFEGCVVGEQYQIEANILPSDSPNSIFFQSVDTDIATVTDSGLVTFLKEGTVIITANITNQPGDYFEIWFTSGTFKPLSGNTSDLFYEFRALANSVKDNSSTLRGYRRTESTQNTGLTISNHKTEGTYADMIDFEKDIIAPTINSVCNEKTVIVSALSLDNENYNENFTTYINKIPVAGSAKTILDDLTPKDIKSMEISDNGSYCYSIRMTLNPESFSSLPSNPSLTKHGQAFDILTNGYISKLVSGTSTSSSVGSMKISYSSFKTYYHDSSITLYINKATNKVESIEYDMSVDSSISSLCLNATVSIFKIKHTANVAFTSRNTVKLEFFG